MNTNIKKLPVEFIGKGEVKGFHFCQIKRGQNACIYKVVDEGCERYEVFKIKVRSMPGTMELFESYPKANSFGIWAWTFRNFEKAFGKFNMIETK